MYRRFNRHQLFNGELMNFHSQTIRLVEDFYMEKNQTWFNELTNMLAGIWDGYLYDNLLPKAKEEGLPIEDSAHFFGEHRHGIQPAVWGHHLPGAYRYGFFQTR